MDLEHVEIFEMWVLEKISWTDRVEFEGVLTSLLTYLLTPWSRVLLEKLTGSQLVKQFPALNGTQMFIAAFTSARHLSLF